MPRIGDVVDGRYEVLAKLGSGSHGTVYLAYDKRRSQKVALKLLDSLEEKDLLRREAKALVTLRHSNNVPRILKYKEDEYVAMEYVRGGTLYDYLRARRRPLVDLRRIFYSLLTTLAEIHEHDMVHADIKPENILMRSTDDVLIADFGLVQSTRHAMRKYVQTRWYRAPEVMLEMPYDGRADVWSLGCVLMAAIEGHSRSFLPSQSTPAQMRDIVYAVDDPLRHENMRAYAPGVEQRYPRGPLLLADRVGDAVRRRNLYYREQVDTQTREQLEDLMVCMLAVNPEERLTAAEAAQHPFFACVCGVDETE